MYQFLLNQACPWYTSYKGPRLRSKGRLQEQQLGLAKEIENEHYFKTEFCIDKPFLNSILYNSYIHFLVPLEKTSSIMITRNRNRDNQDAALRGRRHLEKFQ